MSLSTSKVLGCLVRQIKAVRGYKTAPAAQFPNFSSPAVTTNRAPTGPRQALVQSLSTPDLHGLVTLHPEVFARMPLLHVIRKNIEWQEDARNVNMKHEKNQIEMPGTKRKVWPQKGTGRARHNMKQNHIFLKGGKVHGARKFTNRYFFLDTPQRILGLTSMLSLKFAQDDLVVVDSLSLPSGDPALLEETVVNRHWGPSVLFCDVDDMMPENICEATDPIAHYTLMPAYGLNVFSMVKHDTLVMTLDALRHVESKLIEVIYDPQQRDRDMQTVRRESMK